MPTDLTQNLTSSELRLSKFDGSGNSFLVKLVEVPPAEFEALQVVLQGDSQGSIADASLAQAMEDLLEDQNLTGLASQLCKAWTKQNPNEVFDGLIVGLCPFSLDNPFSLDSTASSSHKPASWPRLTVAMLLRNADGSNGQVSGNGLRCLAHALLRAINLQNPDLLHADIKVLTDIGVREVEVTARTNASADGSTAGEVAEVTAAVRMGPLEQRDSVLPENSVAEQEAVYKRIEEFLAPVFTNPASSNPASSNLTGSNPASRPVPHFRAAYGSIGNPHLVIEVDDLDQAFNEVVFGEDRTSEDLANRAPYQSQLIKLGKTLTSEMSPSPYPSGINVELIAAGYQASEPASSQAGDEAGDQASNTASGQAIRMFVWERGVGITQACGTGAVVAAAQAAKWGLVDGADSIRVCMPGGEALVLLPEAQASRAARTGTAAKELNELEPILLGPSNFNGDLVFNFDTQELREV